MKKKLAIIPVCLGITAGLMACGAPKKEDIIEGMLQTDLSAYRVTTDFDLDANAVYNHENLTLSGGMTVLMESENIQNPEKARIWFHDVAVDKIRVNDAVRQAFGAGIMDLIDSFNDEIDVIEEFETYFLMDESTAYYNFPDEGWFYISMDDTASQVVIDPAEALNISKKLLEEKAVIEKKPVEINGGKYYQVTVTLNGDDIYNYVQDYIALSDEMQKSYDEMTEKLSQEGIDDKDLYEAMSATYTMYVNKTDYQLYEAEGTLQIDVRAILETCRKSIEKTGFDIDAIELLDVQIKTGAKLELNGRNEVRLSTYAKNARDLSQLVYYDYDIEDWDDGDDWEVYEEDNPFLLADGSYEMYTLAGDYLCTVRQMDGYTYSGGDQYSGFYVYYENPLDKSMYDVVCVNQGYTSDVFSKGTTASVPSEYTNYQFDFHKIGTAAGGRDAYYGIESYTYVDGQDSWDYENILLFVPYFTDDYDEQNGSYTLLSVEVFGGGMDLETMTDQERLDLIQDILGK